MAFFLLQKEQKSVTAESEEKTISQMQCYHNLAKEKSAFVTWYDQFKVDCVTSQTWREFLRKERLFLMKNLKQIFPIDNLGTETPTFRWMTLPPAHRIREFTKNESELSVIIGDVAHAIYVIARILGK